MLIERGADVNARNEFSSQTPLHLAALRGDDVVSLLLLEEGAEIHAGDINGDTPLHLAHRFGKVDCEKLLISKGANPSLKNLAGESTDDFGPLPIVNLSYE